MCFPDPRNSLEQEPQSSETLPMVKKNQ
jgi:hypothetical protein